MARGLAEKMKVKKTSQTSRLMGQRLAVAPGFSSMVMGEFSLMDLFALEYLDLRCSGGESLVLHRTHLGIMRSMRVQSWKFLVSRFRPCRV